MSPENRHVLEWQRALGIYESGYFDADTLAASRALLGHTQNVEGSDDEDRPTLPDGCPREV